MSNMDYSNMDYSNMDYAMGEQVLQHGKVMWCIEKPPTWLNKGMLPSVSGDKSFGDSVSFTRWLFSQPRGLGVFGGALLVGWREAKPCAQAIYAARTGDTRGLREDGKRPALLDPQAGTKVVDRAVAVAVKKMIILVEPYRIADAIKWARHNSGCFEGLVVSSQSELEAAMPIDVPKPKQTPLLGDVQVDVNREVAKMSFAPQPQVLNRFPPSLVRPPPGLAHPNPHFLFAEALGCVLETTGRVNKQRTSCVGANQKADNTALELKLATLAGGAPLFDEMLTISL